MAVLIVCVVMWLWCFFFILDFLFGMEPTVKRVKEKKNGKWVVQERWMFSPFYSDVGMGSLDMMSFDSVEYNSREDAESEV